MSQTPDVLRGPHVLEYPYKRSLGPVLSLFFSTLRDRQFEAVRARDGKVLVPPQEYDPQTSEALSEWVPVGPGGEIVSWSWVSRPRAKQPLQHPFAYALIKLDGADVPLLHAVDAREESKLAIGTRVVPRWAEQPKGGIRDVVCFDLEMR